MSKKKIYTLICMIGIITVSGIYIGNKIHQENLIKQTIIDRYTSIGEEFGLQNIEVTITGKSSEYDWYNVVVDSSDLDNISPIDMMKLDKKMGIVDDAFITLYTSNGNKYNIYPSTLSIYKNGEIIYDDYNNSESHKSAIENKSNSSQSSGTTS